MFHNSAVCLPEGFGVLQNFRISPLGQKTKSLRQEVCSSVKDRRACVCWSHIMCACIFSYSTAPRSDSRHSVKSPEPGIWMLKSPLQCDQILVHHAPGNCQVLRTSGTTMGQDSHFPHEILGLKTPGEPRIQGISRSGT